MDCQAQMFDYKLQLQRGHKTGTQKIAKRPGKIKRIEKFLDSE